MIEQMGAEQPVHGAPRESVRLAEWGGESWEALIRRGLDFLGGRKGLAGKQVLDIGTRYGSMALAFAELGACVTGIDVNPQALAAAASAAHAWQTVHPRSGANGGDVRFVLYDGNLDVFADESFDVIFTKSVLVVVPGLEEFLQTMARKLKPGGRVVLMENGYGGPLLHSLRALRHRHWNYHSVRYFTAREETLVRSVFAIDAVEHSHVPPICLFLGARRSSDV
jgi:SAM-dependent methyltransferase